MKTNKTALNAANNQLIGFAHASKGYDVVSLAEGMALTVDEWKLLRKQTVLKEKDIKELDEHFKI